MTYCIAMNAVVAKVTIAYIRCTKWVKSMDRDVMSSPAVKPIFITT